jgi:hypothetical protein
MSKYSGEILFKKIVDRADATSSTLVRISNEDYQLLVKEKRINAMGSLYNYVKVIADPALKIGEVIPVSLILK